MMLIVCRSRFTNGNPRRNNDIIDFTDSGRLYVVVGDGDNDDKNTNMAKIIDVPGIRNIPTWSAHVHHSKCITSYDNNAMGFENPFSDVMVTNVA